MYARVAWEAGKVAKHKTIIVAILVFTIAGFAAVSARAAAGGIDRPLRGTESGTTTLNLDTGAATGEFTGLLSHLGTFSGHSNVTVTFTGPSSFSAAGTGTLVAANGDELFFDTTWNGTFTATTIQTTVLRTITGGTGRFAAATGTMTTTDSSVYSATTFVSHDTGSTEGLISY